jgi:hypothetical protein
MSYIKSNNSLSLIVNNQPSHQVLGTAILVIIGHLLAIILGIMRVKL